MERLLGEGFIDKRHRMPAVLTIFDALNENCDDSGSKSWSADAGTLVGFHKHTDSAHPGCVTSRPCVTQAGRS